MKNQVCIALLLSISTLALYSQSDRYYIYHLTSQEELYSETNLSIEQRPEGAFHPDSLPDPTTPPPRITSVLLHNRDLQETYWRSGQEEVWNLSGPENTVIYTRLPPGRYTIQVQAINREGLESPLSELSFRIFPPWHSTWRFRTFLFIAFIALIYAVFRYRELQRLQQVKLRLRIARDLHDEMGSTLSSISILSEAALHHLQADLDRVRIRAIGERARQVMDAMSDIVWSVNPGNDSMPNVLERMEEFALEILESQGIALHFEATETVKTLKLPMEKRKDFYLLFKEAINNAAKYSCASDVWVSLKAENGRLSMEVRDNGRGFGHGQVNPGNGLWNMQHRAEKLGGKLLLESEERKGTRIWLELPVK